ncbi:MULTISPECIES: HetP family heterocyst commitment protein [Moorena]|nr:MULTISPECIES: HetP family heterocyst commitment protein [Moorena]NEQ17139.1 HetP family heterocyst commitment protein [Moorena sp. SIO3E2]NES85068.1 HetP family heterocyst commitment protein [Moorena sp. SIO2B7]NEP32160.1 HetP family heterocyst commitment protein [Moorena sp. SIO3B2]NEP67272.1 HetP family heterocyst commitment protein [Moorena sp. SIO3A5]NEQ07709.1 HetP family heterocyst commitment protein [Moorena sp. SIO4E2]
MSYSMLRRSNRPLGKTLDPEKISLIEEAIRDRKYSWACVLMLRYLGLNPLEYIPSRTYCRLRRDNEKMDSLNPATTDSLKQDREDAQKCLRNIKDLDYAKPLDSRSQLVQGGSKEQWFNKKLPKLYSSTRNIRCF